MSEISYAVTPMAVEELMNGGGEFQPPARLLSDLTEEQATAKPSGATHSIAQIVTHMHFYQQATLANARRQEWPKPAHLEDTFAAPEPGGWAALAQAFLDGIEECKRAAHELKDRISSARDDTNICYDLAESALHNGYHLGQIVMLRQLQGLWPPAGGDSNDF